MEIREAGERDIDGVHEIYNQVVLTSTAIYEDAPSPLEVRVAWWQARRAAGFPVLVAVEGGEVAGFGTYGEFRGRPGYRFTVEGSIHIREGVRRRGVGRALLDALVERARADGRHVLVAGVDAENAASLGFLESYGFARVGYMPEVGFKFGRYLDLVLLQMRL